MLGNLQDQSGGSVLDLKGVQDGRESIVELDVHDGTDDSHNLAPGTLGLRGGSGSIVGALWNRGSEKVSKIT